ncbi:MAG TPA: class I SAM-dependent methyltransferase [Candidatus Polarisedimenticolaceae bacterium]|nr:class I SAM-dependent methyltransferase [Candidatus Polarisedimenticolaceae bacterium]
MSEAKHPHNPQYEQMADESMVRNLAHQAEAIWPQESAIFRAYDLSGPLAVLDVGCGTGEITGRLAEMYPEATLAGVDLIEDHLRVARDRCASIGARVTFRTADAFALPFGEGTFDLVVCRHMLQAVPRPHEAMAEMVRVLKPGGRLHLLVEDYGMIQMAPTKLDADHFWKIGPPAFGRATGTDLHIGRDGFHHLKKLPVDEIRMHYVVVDTIRVPRETFAGIWEAWRDGYVDPIAQYTPFTREEALAYFDDMIACIRDPEGYAVWQVPILSARKRRT